MQSTAHEEGAELQPGPAWRTRRRMMQPNLLIIGAQKCGTTWLHHVLKNSRHLHGSKIKELNYWNKRKRTRFEDYCCNFEGGSGSETYFYESTPHYFRLPKRDFNIAEIIRESLGDIPLLLMLRNPVDRYLSATTHHMMQGRIEWTEEIAEIDERFGLLALGFYRRIYDVYAREFSAIHTFLFEDMIRDKSRLVSRVMSSLGLENDIGPEDLDIVVNSKARKMARIQKSGVARPMPRLSASVLEKLHKLYRDDILGMQELLQRDLNAWLDPSTAINFPLGRQFDTP